MNTIQDIILNIEHLKENNYENNNTAEEQACSQFLSKELENLLNSSESLLNILKGKDQRITFIEALKPLLIPQQQEQIDRLYKFILLYEICKAFSNS